jgi:hypothetical protein
MKLGRRIVSVGRLKFRAKSSHIVKFVVHPYLGSEFSGLVPALEHPFKSARGFVSPAPIVSPVLAAGACPKIIPLIIQAVSVPVVYPISSIGEKDLVHPDRSSNPFPPDFPLGIPNRSKPTVGGGIPLPLIQKLKISIVDECDFSLSEWNLFHRIEKLPGMV